MSTKTALIVDDSRSARFALRRHLEHHAYQVETAESAEEAFSFLKTYHPAVIFLDHVMPGTDGFTALRFLKENPETDSIPVVICSSNEGVSFNAEARAKGAIDVLQKPPSPEELTRVLENLQALSAQLRIGQPETAPPPAAPSKVTSLREPDVTIGQAVLNVLRHSLGRNDAQHEAPAATLAPIEAPTVPIPTLPVMQPPPTAPAMATASSPPTAAASPPPPQAAAPHHEPVHAPHALRDPTEARLRKLTQDLYTQIAELKAGVALLESRVPDPDEERELLAESAREAVQDLQQRLSWLEARVEARFDELHREFERQLAIQAARLDELPQTLERQLAAQAARIDELAAQPPAAELQRHFDEALLSHDLRIDQVTAQARAAAAEEAHAASERTVMSAAARIADQLADSILKALGRK
jgi:CheY-like chemotaxis protein